METIEKLDEQRKRSRTKSFNAYNKAKQFLNPSKLDKKKANALIDKSISHGAKEIKKIDEILDYIKSVKKKEKR